MNKEFFDYLNLEHYKFHNERVLVFSGVSGSGKTSYINFLLKHNICIKPEEVLIIDEVWKITQLPYIFKNIFSHELVFIASHLNPFIFKIIQFFIPLKQYNLDQYKIKIENELLKRGVKYSQNSIIQFLNEYQCSYIDLNIILDTYQTSDFSTALLQFKKYNSIAKNPLRTSITP